MFNRVSEQVKEFCHNMVANPDDWEVHERYVTHRELGVSIQECIVNINMVKLNLREQRHVQLAILKLMSAKMVACTQVNPESTNGDCEIANRELCLAAVTDKDGRVSIKVEDLKRLIKENDDG